MRDQEQIDSDLPIVGDGVGGSYAFAERLFVAALLNAREHFTAEPWRWRRILRFLTEPEIETVAKFFAARPPTIRAGYATAQDPMPVVSVALASEQPADEFLCDLIEADAQLPEAGDDTRGEIRGTIRQQNLQITIWSDHPDVALYLYHWADYALLAHVGWLTRHGLVNPTFTSGGELAPDARFAPERLFVRQLNWRVAGIAASVEPMPPPPKKLFVFLQGVTVEGMSGGVTVTNGTLNG